jgi:WXG100 family type VII secretion target
MADSEILVTPSELRSHASAIKTQATNSESDFKSMKNRLDSIQSQFRGNAAEAFHERWEEWHTHATGLVQALESLGQFLDGTAQTIEQADADIASRLRS